MATGGEGEDQTADSLTPVDDSELTCHPCRDDGRKLEAVGMCVDCQEHLCRTCFDGHTIPRPFKKHQLLDKQEMMKRQSKRHRIDMPTKLCSSHGDDVIKYYCIDHAQLGCAVCLSADHWRCEAVQYIPHAAKHLDQNAEFKEAESSLKRTLELCKKMSDACVRTTEAIESVYTEALENLETHRRHVNAALDKIHTVILQQADTMKQTALDMISSNSAKCRAAQRELHEFQNRTEQLQRKHQNCGLYTNMIEMKDRLEVVESTLKEANTCMASQSFEVNFIPNMQLLEMLKISEIFGSVTGTKPPRNTDLFDQLNRKDHEVATKVEHVKDINVKTTKEKNECRINGSTFLSDAHLVITDSASNTMKTVDIQKNHVIAKTTLSSSPCDVCKIEKDQVAVTLPSENKIAIVKIKGSSMNVARNLSVSGECRGVDFKDNKLAVSFYKGPHHKVLVLSLKGSVLHDIRTDRQGQAIFNYPHFLTFDQAGTTLYVTNSGGNNVVHVKLDGTLIDTYSDNELKYPVGVTVDKHGYVYVCGYNSHTLHQINPSARKIRDLLGRADGLKCPYSISYNGGNGTLCLGMHYNNNVDIYKAVTDSHID